MKVEKLMTAKKAVKMGMVAGLVAMGMNAVAQDYHYQPTHIVNNGDDHLRVMTSTNATRYGKFWMGANGLVLEAVNPASTYGLHFYASGTEKMRIRGDNGFVGIGTSSPSSKLHVAGKLTISGVSGSGSEALKIGTERAWAFVQNGSGAGANMAFKDLTGGKYFQIMSYSGTEEFSVHSNDGCTYIGGLDPATYYRSGYRLFVNEGILTEKVKVAVKSTSDWADYVFADDYKLADLQEVEAYIEENNHLPGVPSAEEMVTTGLDVAKSDAMLLQKIEELTLYIIDMQKEIDELKTK